MAGEGVYAAVIVDCRIGGLDLLFRRLEGNITVTALFERGSFPGGELFGEDESVETVGVDALTFEGFHKGFSIAPEDDEVSGKYEIPAVAEERQHQRIEIWIHLVVSGNSRVAGDQCDVAPVIETGSTAAYVGAVAADSADQIEFLQASQALSHCDPGTGVLFR